MSDVLVDQDTMEDIGDAIREKLGVSDTYLPASMPAAIRSISGGGGGGSAKYSETVLWSGHAMPANTEYTLIESIENFNALVLMGAGYETNSISQMHIPLFVPTSQIEYGTTVDFGYLANGSNLSVERRPSLVFTDSTHFKVINANTAGNTNCGFVSVIGIRWETMQTALIYSEEEREVGVWTDGKPLYQKTYIFDINDLHSGSVTSSDIHGEFWIDNLNDDKIWLKEGFVANTAMGAGDTGIVSHPSNYPSNGGTYLRSNIQVNSSINNGYPFIYFQATYNASALYNYRNDLLFIFTICYTKTTDTAGSGTWTTTGEYAHHYSTTEHVIGTWIDGKSIYETTYIFSSPLSVDAVSWKDTSIAASDKETIIGVVGISPSGTCWNYLSAARDTGSYVRLLNIRNSVITIDRLVLQYTKTT